VTVLGGYDLVIFDLDGVVYLGTQAVPGAVEAIRGLADHGTRVEYVTNNASRTAEEVSAVLRSLGVDARAEQVVTSARAAAQRLALELPAGSRVLVVGAPSLAGEVRDVGLTPVERAEDGPVAVVQGFGPAVGWADLAEACVAVRNGVRWVVTNPDTTLPSPRGPLPGNGSLVAVLRTALGGRAPDLVVGKPAPDLFTAAAARAGARRPLVVGDRLDTDIAAAVAAGMDSLLVLTGVSSGAEVVAALPAQRPTYVASDLSGLSRQDSEVRIPAPALQVAAGGWTARRTAQGIVLSGQGELDAAVRVLAATAWSGDDAVELTADGVAARRALDQLR
jgi:HAD superfamily hydrolase (TIGR01450 family)